MKSSKRNTRPPRRPFVDGEFSEQTRRRRPEPQPLRKESFDPSHYGRQNREGSYFGAYSRSAARAEYAQKRQQNKRKKKLLIALAVVVVFLLGGVGFVCSCINDISSNLHEGLDANIQDHLVETDLAKEPFYMLLMGTDGSKDRETSEEYAGDQFRSDSMMLVRVDPVNKKVTLVSLQRDTLVDMGEYGEQKLNAAHFFGGASLAIQEVSELAGVPISHYAEINFDGFRDIVNALGGIEVNVPMEINDSEAGGYLAAGLQTLNGDQALILCRARDAYNVLEKKGDVYRAANQRLVLAAIAKKILTSDIATMASTITALSQYVTTDLELLDIVGLAQAMRGLNPETDIYSAMEPTNSAYVGETWYEYLDTAAWTTMMDRVKQGLPPTEESLVDETGTILANSGSGGSQTKTGNLVVKNGSGITGAASTAGDKLKTVGYTVEVGNADSDAYPETLIVYNAANKAQEAEEIATTIGIGKVLLNDGTYSFTGDFLVVIGADWK